MKKLSFILIPLFAGIQFWGCLDIPDEVVVPEWDVDLNVPILSRIYDLEDMVESQNDPLIEIDPEDSLYLVNSDDYYLKSGVFEFMEISLPANEDTIITTDLNIFNAFVPFPENAKIVEAEIFEGMINITTHNLSPISNMNINIKIPGLTDPQGHLFEVDITLEPDETNDNDYDISGYSYLQPITQPAEQEGKIWIRARATSNSEMVTAADFSVTTSNFKFNSARGYLPKRSLGVQESSTIVDAGTDVLGFRDRVVLDEVELSLHAEYFSEVTDPFDIKINNLEIIGKRNNGSESIVLTFDNPEELDIRFSNNDFDTLFTKENSNLEDFVAFIPSEIVIVGEYIINPDDNTEYRSVTNEDSLIFVTNFNTKSVVAIRSSTVLDTVDVKFSDRELSAMNNSNMADITFNLENRLPLSTFIKITMLDAGNNELFIASKTNDGIDSLEFFGASVDNTGKILEPGISSRTVSFSTQNIVQLINAKKAVVSVSIRTIDAYDDNEDPPLVQLRSNDWIKLKVYGVVNYHMNPGGNK